MNSHTLHRALLGSLAPLAFASAGAVAAATSTAALSPERDVAVIGTEHLRLADLSPSVASTLAALDREHERQVRQAALSFERARHAKLEDLAKNFLDARLMAREAEAEHLTVPELIKTVKNPEVSDEDVKRFYEEHKQQINKPFAEVLAPINQYLVQQSADEGKRQYLDALYDRYHASLVLEPLRDSVDATGPERGTHGARVTIIEFGDFQCPYCAALEPVLKSVLERYPRNVRLVFRNMPLTNIHPQALAAARAAVCADRQSRYWEMHDALFSQQSHLSDGFEVTTAASLNLDAAAFSACIAAPGTSAAVSADVAAAEAHGVDGTPALFVNGRFVSGAVSFTRLAELVDDELRRAARGTSSALLTATPSTRPGSGR
jgi:protein-disulfide isomerase